MPCTWGKSAFPKFQSPTDNRQYHCGALYRFPERQRRLQNCMGDPDPNLPVVWWTDVSLSNAQSSKWRFAKSVLHTQQKAKPLYALPGICYESATKQLPEYYPQIHYLQEYTGFPIYADTETHYLTPGERKLETLLAELEKAEKYIFLEYFIVQDRKSVV